MSIYAECGHNYYGNSCGKCATEAGAQQERAKIVAWLRKTANMNPQTPEASAFVLLLCKAIEAREYL
jgi:hypothetical protein